MSVVFNWRKAKTVEVTRDKMNEIIDTLMKKYPDCEFQWSAKLTARRRMFFSGKWSRSSCGGMVTVHDATYEFEDDFVIFSFNANNSVREGLESKEVFGGLQSYDMVNSFYREKFGNDQATIAAGITARKFQDEYCRADSDPVFKSGFPRQGDQWMHKSGRLFRFSIPDCGKAPTCFFRLQDGTGGDSSIRRISLCFLYKKPSFGDL